MRVIRGRTFGAERVQVDRTEFVECDFQGSTFVFRGLGLPLLTRCTVGDVAFDFEGAAYETIKWLRFIRLSGGQHIIDAHLTMRRDKIN